MNYLDIKRCNMVNGTGLRTVIWVAGCERKCPGCFSPYTHDFTAGIKFDEKAKEELFKDSNEDWCAGITLLGGEPLHDANFAEVLAIAKEHKKRFPSKTIWLYTGYTYNDIINDAVRVEILNYVDVLCDGPFIKELKDPKLHWVGSSNQNVIDISKRISQVRKIIR